MHDRSTNLVTGVAGFCASPGEIDVTAIVEPLVEAVDLVEHRHKERHVS
jgi:hypothetical protein